MTTIALNYLKVQRKFLPKINPVGNFEKISDGVNWKIVFFAAFFAVLFLLILYVWQINALTKGFFYINNYEKQIQELSDENKTLQISFAESDFLKSALLKAEALNFQKVTSAKYIQILDSSVAQK